jgi:hypothetical protein
MKTFNIKDFDVAEFDRILAKGLSEGLGERGKQVCIEAAICQTLGLPHGDDPGCVAESVRRFKITLNDARWSSPRARAKGLHDLGLAQLGSKGAVEDKKFTRRLTKSTIQVLIPTVFRDVLSKNKECLEAADRCEREGTKDAAYAASAADKYLKLSAKLALDVLRELNSPGVALLK